jgi:hypothetical protein
MDRAPEGEDVLMSVLDRCSNFRGYRKRAVRIGPLL